MKKSFVIATILLGLSGCTFAQGPAGQRVADNASAMFLAMNEVETDGCKVIPLFAGKADPEKAKAAVAEAAKHLGDDPHKKPVIYVSARQGDGYVEVVVVGVDCSGNAVKNGSK